MERRKPIVPGTGFITDVTASRTLRWVALYALGMTAYSALPVLLDSRLHFLEELQLPPDLHAVFTLVLGWLLVFRTNTSYSRWWEARQLWGSLVNISRNLAIKVADLVRADDTELRKFRLEIIAYSYALRDHLRGESGLQKLPGFEASNDYPSHVPSYLMGRMYERFGAWKSDGFIDGHELRALDLEARNFLEICGGCERIRNTLVVRSYRTFSRQCVALYLITFPWGIVDTFGWWTLPLTAMVSYFMLGLETVAGHVEQPFGYDEDDLNLDGLCSTIEVTVGEVFDRRTARGNADRRSYPVR